MPYWDILTYGQGVTSLLNKISLKEDNRSIALPPLMQAERGMKYVGYRESQSRQQPQFLLHGSQGSCPGCQECYSSLAVYKDWGEIFRQAALPTDYLRPPKWGSISLTSECEQAKRALRKRQREGTCCRNNALGVRRPSFSHLTASCLILAISGADL